MKIAVYTITKNEEQFIKRWADSCAEADYRLIVDTGSTDDTVAVAQENGCAVGSIIIRPWRFDDARNAALALLPEDIDYCIALDADEILMPGWRQELEKVPSFVTRPRYKYVWSWNDDGTEGLTYSGDKIHARKNYRWKHPVHEVIICTDKEEQGWTNLEIHHHPDQSKSRSQYLPLLELSVREEPNDDRNLFYLGRELMFNGRNAEAEVHLRRHLELSTWRAERATCMRYLGRVTGDKEHWLLRACAEAPDRREPWVDLAQFYYDQKRWEQSFAACSRALSIQTKPLEYLCEAEAWGSLPHDLASIAAWNIGLRNIARVESEKALALNPRDQRLRNNTSLVYSLIGSTPIDVVIPTKSNVEGLKKLVPILAADERVLNIIIVGDGRKGAETAQVVADQPKVKILTCKSGKGIHAMWNMGMKAGSEWAHCAFVNDDITLSANTLNILGSQLDHDANLGLLCPNYDNRLVPGTFQPVSDVCGGRYDGTGGLGGFCMMLPWDIRSKWLFDENMIWWFGDDDILHWVTKTEKRIAAISGLATCADNESWTITNDPPDNFARTVESDRSIFASKWGQG